MNSRGPSIEDGISVVLGSYNRRRFLHATIESVRSNGIALPFEIIVVDGGSTDGAVAYLTRQRDVTTIVQHNRGTWQGRTVEHRSWGSFMNLAVKCARGKFICMISDDSLLVPGAVMAGLESYHAASAEGRKVGAVAFYWRNWPDQERYWVGWTIANKMFVNHGLYLRETLREVGWFEEDLYSFYHTDGDVCLKMHCRGYEVIDCPRAFVEHFAHAARRVRKSNLQTQARDWEAYIRRWAGVFGEPEGAELGGWRYLDFVDPHRTTRHFPRLDILTHRMETLVARSRTIARSGVSKLRG
jgi:glycosyltransferase involved in cell wall biosynthesis